MHCFLWVHICQGSTFFPVLWQICPYSAVVGGGRGGLVVANFMLEKVKHFQPLFSSIPLPFPLFTSYFPYAGVGLEGLRRCQTTPILPSNSIQIMTFMARNLLINLGKNSNVSYSHLFIFSLSSFSLCRRY